MSAAAVRAAKCQNSECGLRYPSPADDPRQGTCPSCAAPTVPVATYRTPFDHDADTANRAEVCVVLDNVRSALNVGTMLRACDGAGVGHAYLCGISPSGDHPKVIKTSLGAERSVSWSHHRDATAVVGSLRDEGWTVWAVESTDTSGPFAEAAVESVTIGGLPTQVVLVVGNETAGVDPALLDLADRHVHLPMAGAKTTLNVGVALGAALYAVRTAEAFAARS